MDTATIIGLVIGFVTVVVVMLLGGSFWAFFNFSGMFLVIGGCLATSFIRFSLKDVIGALSVAGKAFAETPSDGLSLIREMMELGSIARKQGLITLEQHPISDDFLRKGIMYCADGHDAEFIREMLSRDVALMEERHERGRSVLTTMGDAAPAFGLLGTLVGLVRMLSTLEQPASIGPAMAVAVLSTLYGVLIAHLVLFPLADKLLLRSEEEARRRLLIIEGLRYILKGLNPRIMAESLQTFLPPAERVDADADF